jgi:hypothetical protein
MDRRNRDRFFTIFDKRPFHPDRDIHISTYPSQSKFEHLPRAEVKLSLSQHILWLFCDVTMELRDSIDAISNLQIVQIVGRKLFDIYVASIALDNRFQGSSLFRFLENYPTLVIVTIIIVLFFKALTGAFVPVEKTAILSTTNDRCSRLILRSSLP